MMKKRKRIGFISRFDPKNEQLWADASKRRHTYSKYNMLRALEDHNEVERIACSLDPLTSAVHLADRAYHRYLSSKSFSKFHTFLYAKNIAKTIDAQLRTRSYDLLFASKGSTEIAFLETSIPIVYHSDATFQLVVDYYRAFTNLPSRNISQGNEIEKRALEKASHVILISNWAKESAMTHYGIPEDKISVIPSAADLPDEPRRDSLRWGRTGDCCRLLFVGVDWEEKGGRIAFNTMRCLHRMGIDASLTVIGCTPPPEYRHEKLLVIPFLDKSSEGDRRRFDQLYRDSHFFIVPSRAEALGIALCEACAFGLPILTAETGGTGEIVEDGVNGVRVPLHDEGEGYARFIEQIWSDADGYAMMRRNSRNKYERDLNWEVWGERVQRVIDALGPSLHS